MMHANHIVDIGTRLMLRVALLMVLVYLVYALRDVVLIALLAVLTAAAFSPLVDRMERWKFSRSGAVVMLYLGFFTSIILFLSLFVPVLLSEIKNFTHEWPRYGVQLSGMLTALEDYFHSFGVNFSRAEFFADIESTVSHGAGNLVATTVGLFSGLIHFLGYFFLSLYLSLEENGIEKFFLALTPEQYHETALGVARKIRHRVSRWLGAQLLLMFIVFVIYYIGLSLLGVPYAFIVALFGGLVEIIPYIGPVLAAVPAILLGLFDSSLLGFSVGVFYLITHQIESHFIAPQVMKHSAGLNPVVLILAVLIGIKLGGPFGAVIAVPAAMIAGVFVEDFLEKKHVGKQGV